MNVVNEHAEAEEEVKRKNHWERLIKHLHFREVKQTCWVSGALCRNVVLGEVCFSSMSLVFKILALAKKSAECLIFPGNKAL